MIKAIKGTRDIFYEEIVKWRKLETRVKEVFEKFNYSEIRTPIFEETKLFSRSIGEATDIVSKEMYTFIDRSGISLTLKPEMTASVARAFIEHNFANKYSLNKLYYISPMFRQERPQAGRLREFHQFGAEAIGSQSPVLDAEMILMAYEILSSLGLKKIKVKINSLGLPKTREHYKTLLRSYLKPYFTELSGDSQKRFSKNILRIFDSKEKKDRAILENAPLLLDHLDEVSLEHFNEVREILDEAGIIYEVEPKLVRGLDYYTHTTFEIISQSVGAQSALCGGGRYDLLIEQLGGKKTAGVGFAAGMERILLACKNEGLLDEKPENVEVYVSILNKDLYLQAYKLVLTLRKNGIKTETDYLNRSLKAQMREANKLGANFVIFFGGNELEEGKASLKNMKTGSQAIVPLDEIHEKIKDFQ